MHGLSIDDITIIGGTKASLEGRDGNCSYTLIVTPEADQSGVITISIPAGAVIDAWSNCNQAVSQSFNTDYNDNISPSLTISDNTNGVSATDVSFTFKFSEPVLAFRDESPSAAAAREHLQALMEIPATA